MKTLSTLILALLFAAGSAFAQSNDATVNQEGNGNDATVTQKGSGHSAEIDQDTWGDGHTAVVDQNSGSDSYAYILQDQRGAEAYVEQVGSENEARLKQSGPNEADIFQQGDGNVLGQYGNLERNAFQKNGTSFADDKNWLELDQIGNGNVAGVWQEHHGEVSISQTGNNNDSHAYQNSQPGGSLNSSSATIIGDGNSTDTYQLGEGNSASINIGPYVNYDNTVEMEQRGDGNAASFSVQMGDGNDVDVSQTGNSNYSEYSVKYGDDNSITANVVGDGNRTRFSIDTDWGSMSSENYLNVEKSGDMNYLTGAVKGNNNTINVLQDGDNNRIGTSWYTKDGVNIQGDSNMVDVMQQSDGNSAFVGISGNSNTATISQN